MNNNIEELLMITLKDNRPFSESGGEHHPAAPLHRRYGHTRCGLFLLCDSDQPLLLAWKFRARAFCDIAFWALVLEIWAGSFFENWRTQNVRTTQTKIWAGNLFRKLPFSINSGRGFERCNHR